MTNLDNENQILIEELQAREAGVAELFEFYAGVEAVYTASLHALEEGNISVVAQNANN